MRWLSFIVFLGLACGTPGPKNDQEAPAREVAQVDDQAAVPDETRSQENMNTPRSVASLADIQPNHGAEVTVTGIYRQVDIRRKQKPPAQYRGHVAIELADGHRIMLEPSWSDAALRPAEERQRFDGKPVVVVGTLHATPPPPPEPVAALDMPCLSPVQRVDAQ